MLVDVLAEEFRRLPVRLGGTKGILVVGLLLALAGLPPYKFGTAFLDPRILLAYIAFALLFAGPFAVQSFGGASEKAVLQNRSVPARDLALGKIAASSLYGWGMFAASLGTALVVLNSILDRPVWLSTRTMTGMVLLSVAAAWFAAAVSARVTLAVQTPQAARQLLRLAFLFGVLVVVLLPRLLPVAARELIYNSLTRRQFPVTCMVLAAPVLVLAAWLTASAVSALEDRRQGLSILAED